MPYLIMTGKNNATLTRRELQIRLWQLLEPSKKVELESMDRIPLVMRPKKGSPIRCCVYKDRAVLKYKMMAMLGYNAADEKDELDRISDYFVDRLQNKSQSRQVLTVVDEACSACHTNQYVITNMCRGCEARPCIMNCPKDAISMNGNQAEIDYDKCVNCGLCLKNCPFHAISFIPVPCEEACPVGAISKNDEGIEVIDESKCILCGKCITRCPFGAIVEKSFIPDIYREWMSCHGLIALVAPALDGQFRHPLKQVYGAIKRAGFDGVAEVAWGADMVAEAEATELSEALENGDKLMTSSCCASYNILTQKIITDLKPYQSETKTPLQVTAERVKKLHPNHKVVFVSPCIAKKSEAFDTVDVDFVLSIEELASLFAARDIQPENCKPLEPLLAGSEKGKIFSESGGVMSNIISIIEEPFEKEIINGFDKAEIKKIKNLVKKSGSKEQISFVEVMACEGGCLGGCNTVVSASQARRMKK